MQISLRVTPEVYEAIKAVAAAEKRSVNRQLELMIEDWLRRRGEAAAPREVRELPRVAEDGPGYDPGGAP